MRGGGRVVAGGVIFEPVLGFPPLPIRSPTHTDRRVVKAVLPAIGAVREGPQTSGRLTRGLCTIIIITIVTFYVRLAHVSLVRCARVKEKKQNSKRPAMNRARASIGDGNSTFLCRWWAACPKNISLSTFQTVAAPERGGDGCVDVLMSVIEGGGSKSKLNSTGATLC